MTAIIDRTNKPSLIEADKIKNLAKKPANGGIPARENKKTSIAIDFERELKRSPFNSEIFV